jgi:hypothetical protein
MNTILRNEKLDKQLKEEGYAVVNFINQEQINELIALYQFHHKDSIPGFYASVFSDNVDKRQAITAKIKSIYEPIVAELFIDYRMIGGIFIVKTNEEKERLHPHQDWGFIDEDKYQAFNIWVPLVDVNETNGAFRITPGSHLWVKNYRGPQLPESFPEFQEEIWQNMTTMNLKAGQGVIYDARLFHASYPNTTDFHRIATVFGAIPKDIEMLHYIRNNNKVSVYESNEAFFLGSNINRGSEVLKKLFEVKFRNEKNKNLPGYLKKADSSKKSWLTRLFR